ncbi:O-linked N-acetylglucosamine transferase, SPINDLY family protein [Allorhizobium undicola]|uniref:O-linked N-acetylglucosamine transferase, SPINDLY family protein n=1 Tax=Allorhizobium undicola TaxID=78527 RepID=UPI000686D251|nr:hypothetical protein [Allorhizobium undicola]
MTTVEQVLAAYRTGELDKALALADQVDPSLPAIADMVDFLRGGIRLKQADRRGAAEAFARVGLGASPNANVALTHAVTLHSDLADHAAVARLAGQAMARLPMTADLAFRLAKALFAQGQMAEAAPIIGALDPDQRPHLELLVAFHSAFSRQSGYFDYLKGAVSRFPENPFLVCALIVMARGRSELLLMEQLTARFDEPGFGDRLRRFEFDYARLLRSESEAENALASFGSLEVLRNRALHGGLARRRAMSATGRIRLAYFSSDFHRHATMTLFFESLLAHDRTRFDVVLLCYSEPEAARVQADWPEPLRSEIIPVRDRSSAEIIALIRDLGIDILIDLHGYTARARLDVVDLSDAPVKASYLGFPGSVHDVDLDYAITDPIVTPDAAKPFYSEKLCRLPETYQANGAALRPRPKSLSRGELGLPDNVFLFASFNGAQKIEGKAVALWASVLRAVPEAMLALIAVPETAEDNLRAAFAAHAIGPERLVFSGQSPYDLFISKMAACDLALDTLIYTGHTTTSDALWAGLPVLTRKGKTFAGRVSESLLRAVGLPDLVAQDEADFVEKAAMLARHPDRLAEVRERLARQRETFPLFDVARFTRHLERGYELMAERARAGLPPDHIDVPASAFSNASFFPNE